MSGAARDYSAHVRKHASMTVRVLLVALGSVFLLLGLVGVFTPVLPTTPFVLLAAACYARASTRFYNRLLNNPTFGPVILEWQRHRSIPWRVKLVAVATMSISFAVSIVFFVRPQALQVALAVFGLALGAWLWRIPSRDRPGAPPASAQAAAPAPASAQVHAQTQPPEDLHR